MIIVLYVVLAAIVWFFAFVCYYLYQSRKMHIVKEINFEMPKSWKDLTEKQFLYVCQLFLMENTQDEILTKCFLFFNKIKVIEQSSDEIWLCKSGKKKFLISIEDILCFSKKAGFIVNGFNDIKPLASLAKSKPINYRFEGVPFKQWLVAENYYQAFIYSKNEQYLDMLCAVIYSEGIDFDDSQTFERSKRFSKTSDVHRFTVFMVYMGFKELLSKQFPYFFKKTSGQDSLERSTPNMREHINNMLNVLDGGDATKTDQILYIDSWRAFDKLNRKAREIQETEERLNKMKQR